MSQLGSVFEGFIAEGDGPRGRDLHGEVRLPRAYLGRGPVVVQLPAQLPTDDGSLGTRTPGPGEHPDQVTLNLPRGVPDGATLRLRGQGEGGAGRVPGDLYLKVYLTGPAAAPAPGAPPTVKANAASPMEGGDFGPALGGGVGRPLLGLALGGGLLALLGWLATRALG